LSENRVLRRVFGPSRNEVTGEWRKLHNGKLHKMYSTLDIIRQIKSRRIKRVGHVAHMGRLTNRLWGETDVSELRPLRAYSSPDDYDVDHGMIISTDANS
jgi:hypothetical protein